MGFLDRLFGRGDDRERQQQQQQPMPRQPGRPTHGGNIPPDQLTDEQAVERYRYMLRTAPPETVEQAHAEAFARLTPEQRGMVLQELSQTLPESERAAGGRDDPQSLARMATRAEMRQPGTLERTFGGMGGGGIGMGGLLAGSFLSSFAGMFLGSMIAQQFFDNSGDQGSVDGGGDSQEADSADAADTGETDAGASDAGGYADSGGFDSGGDFGGGDFGGGDFGGGDFGGGDF